MKGARGGRGKRGAVKGKGKRHAHKMRSSNRRGVPERATCTETTSIADLNMNTSYNAYNASLSSTTRAVVIAQGYQYYRIKSIKYILRPQFDTFISNGATGTVPYLYYMIDRTKQLVNLNSDSKFRALGAKPHRVDDKTITFQYKPSVLNSALDGGNLSNAFVQYKVSPWIPTRDTTSSVWVANSTDHQGIVWGVFANASPPGMTYGLERVIEFEFCKPARDLSLGEGEVPSVPAHPELG